MPKRILLVCSANIDRSPTAEGLCRNLQGIEAKSAGVSSYARVPITRELVEWADAIFAMEQKHKTRILEIYPKARSKITVLNIPDIYYCNQLELRKLFLKKLKPFFSKENYHKLQVNNMLL